MTRFSTACVLLLGLTAQSAAAVDFSFIGALTSDNDVALFDFTVGATSNVTLRTYSYAGGTMADGTVIAAGGFDPILALFDGSGVLIDQNDDGSSVPPGPVTGVGFDTLLETTLAAGSYTVSVMQYDNFANGPKLADGFRRDGQGNFTGILSGGCGAPLFCDVTGDARTGNWAFDILNVSEAVIVTPRVPLPAAMPLLLGGLGGLMMLRRRVR
ncbi:hypothetical protein DKT77_08685 [Meridianimarinicoccus roseus]|uniref:Secreted protein n=1 Tax=Meridianimarinicoccus roseus TaxID=2072018 RepID=A0A2V2LIK8_9RHOB|nr:DVUA0089 family protein [Meridianimarinicoccus roseus]PWR03006.1 hypothetical protein DKT77_08685 [Meridianimarinicoccus roseus]